MPGPIDEFCESLRSDLNARRAKSHAELDLLRQLVFELATAREAALVAAFAAPLNLKVPTYRGATAGAVHARLLLAVEALIEGQAAKLGLTGEAALVPAPSRQAVSAHSPSSARGAFDAARSEASQNPVPTPRWPTLEGLLGQGPIVVVGGSRGEKLTWLPATLRAAVEWIETTRQGTHAIGNLAQRIRQRRVLALIVLDGVIGHKHSEPLVTAAREVKIPTAYANKGGAGALARAFTQLEKMVGAP